VRICGRLETELSPADHSHTLLPFTKYQTDSRIYTLILIIMKTYTWPAGIRYMRRKSVPSRQACSEHHGCIGLNTNLWMSDKTASFQTVLGLPGQFWPTNRLCMSTVGNLLSDILHIWPNHLSLLLLSWQSTGKVLTASGWQGWGSKRWLVEYTVRCWLEPWAGPKMLHRPYIDLLEWTSTPSLWWVHQTNVF